jgi:ABC-2 type transport system permease protein
MNKVWNLIKHEYTRHVLRRRFLVALLSVPLWIVFAIGMGILSVVLATDSTPVGYIDQAGIIVDPVLREDSGPAGNYNFIAYTGEAEARAALNANQVQAYFVIPPDFVQTRSAAFVYNEQPNNRISRQFNNLLRQNLLADQDPLVAQRVLQGPALVIEATQENRTMAENEWFKIGAPIAAAIFLVVSVFTSSGYLMQAVVEEKENRTMEVLATSLSPEQIMGGKILALIAVGLTQVLVWSFFPLLALVFARAALPFLQDVAIDWRTIGLVMLTILPTFVLISALMATIGATVTEAREGQQISGLVTLPVMAPFMLLTPILLNPGGPVSLFLSFFPLTAAMTILLRLAFSSVPDWQALLSAGILILSALGSLWLAGRVFRLGMLQYGRRLGLKDVMRAAVPGRRISAGTTRKESI